MFSPISSCDIAQKSGSRDANKVTEANESSTSKMSDDSVCDSSSHMNLVYDEVEIDTYTGDLSEQDATIDSSTEVNDGKSDAAIASSSDLQSLTISKQNTVQEIEPNTINKCRIVDTEKGTKCETNEVHTSCENIEADEDVPLSQASEQSGSSREWQVIDSVESEEEEEMSQGISKTSQEDRKGGITDIIKDQSSSPTAGKVYTYLRSGLARVLADLEVCRFRAPDKFLPKKLLSQVEINQHFILFFKFFLF